MARSQTLPNTDQLAGQRWTLCLLDLMFVVINLFLSKFLEGL